jgi:hypothetical protein
MTAATSTIAPVRTAPGKSPPTEAEIEAEAVREPELLDPRPEPPVSRPQCMQALARANEVRLARAALKREVRAGRRGVIDIVLECPWQAQSMSLLELLGSQRRWGRARSRKLLSSTGLTEMKQLGTLTQRQRGILVRALYAKRGLEQPAT